MTTALDYESALWTLDKNGRVSRAAKQLLANHYRRGAVTADELGRSLGWVGKNATNLCYGKLGKHLFRELNSRPTLERYANGRPIWISSFIAISSSEHNGNSIRWELRPAVRKAIERIGWSDAHMAELDCPQVWVVKACAEKGGHWRNYFERDHRSYLWGGDNGKDKWIHSTLSMQILREAMKPNDLIVAYQRDDSEYGRAIFGFTTTTTAGQQDDDGEFTQFKLAATRDSLCLEQPLRIADLRKAQCDPKCFRRGPRGTIYPMTMSEVMGVVEAIIINTPGQREELDCWLRGVGLRISSAIITSTTPRSSTDGQAQMSRKELEAKIDSLESELANRSNNYVRKKVFHVIRNDRRFIAALKQRYRYRCQFPGCHIQIQTHDGGYYCEVAHLHPVARGGKPTRVNLVVLCPNHHKMIDVGETKILDATREKIVGTLNGQRFTIRR